MPGRNRAGKPGRFVSKLPGFIEVLGWYPGLLTISCQGRWQKNHNICFFVAKAPHKAGAVREPPLQNLIVPPATRHRPEAGATDAGSTASFRLHRRILQPGPPPGVDVREDVVPLPAEIKKIPILRGQVPVGGVAPGHKGQALEVVVVHHQPQFGIIPGAEGADEELPVRGLQEEE